MKGTISKVDRYNLTIDGYELTGMKVSSEWHGMVALVDSRCNEIVIRPSSDLSSHVDLMAIFPTSIFDNSEVSGEFEVIGVNKILQDRIHKYQEQQRIKR